MVTFQFDDLVSFRHRLHRVPELAGAEKGTANIVFHWLEACKPDALYRNVGGHGLVAVFDSGIKGDTVVLRADLDALPIHETGVLSYRSMHDGVAHVCGHDGHMAILAGVAKRLSVHRPPSGRVALLFQPAEETGEGAARIVLDPIFRNLHADWIFGAHNLPGVALAEVQIKSGSASCASIGIIIKLEGRTAHAAQPELGRSPAKALSRLVDAFGQLADSMAQPGYAQCTVIHARLGEVAFGTAPGEATIMATMRADSDSALRTMKAAAEEMVREVAERDGLQYKVSFADSFPATVNDERGVAIVEAAAKKADLFVTNPPDCLRWSEDFAWYGRAAKAVLVGLGAGKNQAALHNPDYDFPDDLIEPGARLFEAIVTGVLG
jgi:amidohydrolase